MYVVKRLISDEPVLARTIRKSNLGILPTDIREWAISWAEDIGRTVRSREVMLSMITTLIYRVGLTRAIKIVEGFGITSKYPIVDSLVKTLKNRLF